MVELWTGISVYRVGLPHDSLITPHTHTRSHTNARMDACYYPWDLLVTPPDTFKITTPTYLPLHPQTPTHHLQPHRHTWPTPTPHPLTLPYLPTHITPTHTHTPTQPHIHAVSATLPPTHTTPHPHSVHPPHPTPLRPHVQRVYYYFFISFQIAEDIRYVNFLDYVNYIYIYLAYFNIFLNIII